MRAGSGDASSALVRFADRPDRIVPSRDGTRIAVFTMGEGPALILVHGTSGDHRTWRVAGPLLARRHQLWAVDRRGRGDSGDAPEWSIERELEDVAAVAEAAAQAAGGPVAVFGHSLGGRFALGASRLTPAIHCAIAYEGAPGLNPAPASLVHALRIHLDAGDLDGLLAVFMTEAVGMPAADLAAFRANAIWPLRAAAGPTIVRELEAAGAHPAIGIDALADITVPVLQLAGSESPAWFRDGAVALDARLVRGRLEVIEGARHAAHHSHAPELVARVEAFLAER